MPDSKQHNELQQTYQNWVIATKLFPPQHFVGLVKRTQLFDVIKQAPHAKVHLITSPAGYGKTSLLCQWRQDLLNKSSKVAWLTLDENDGAPNQFISYLILSLTATGFEGARTDALNTEAEQGLPHITVNSAIANLLNQIREYKQEIVLILDDYHRVESEEINQLMNALIEHLPNNLRLIISSRNQPGFKISTLKIHKQLHQLTAQQLRFSEDEAQQLFANELAAPELNLLMQQTEGWPVALQLARLWLQGQQQNQTKTMLADNFSGRIVDVAQYFIEQILSSLPEEHKDFLIKTSMVERFNGDLANALCERDDCWQILQQLTQFHGLLVPLDNEQQWYRYHHLFAEFLQDLLKRNMASKLPQLHITVSNWYEQQGHFPEAVQHAKLAGDFERAAKLIADMGGWRITLQAGEGLLNSLLDGLPESIIKQFISLQLIRVFLLIKQGRYTDADALLQQVRASQAEMGTSTSTRGTIMMQITLSSYRDQDVSRTEFEFIQHFLAEVALGDHVIRAGLLDSAASISIGFSDLIKAQEYSQQCIDEYQRAGSNTAMLYGLFLLIESQILQGLIQQAEKNCHQAIQLLEGKVDMEHNLTAVANILFADVLYTQNKLTECQQRLPNALRHVAEHDGWINIYASSYQTAASFAYATQGLQAALNIIEQGKQTAQKRELPRLTLILQAKEIQLLVKANELASASEALQNGKFDSYLLSWKDKPSCWREYYAAGVAQAELSIAQLNTAKALQILQDLHQASETGLRHSHLIHILALQALCHWLEKDRALASDKLERALEMARLEHIRSVFIDLPSVADPLLKYSQKQVANSLNKKFIDYLLVERKKRRRLQDKPRTTLLSTREMEVLVELNKGHSDKEIARNLNITLRTVNFHLNNLYKKLGVNKRSAAVAVAHQRSLIF